MHANTAPVITPQHNPYEFITSPQNKPIKSLVSGGGGPKKLLLIVGGLTSVVSVLALLATILGGGAANKQDYTTMLQQHAELIRVAELGSKSAQDNTAKNLAITTKQTLNSQTAAITKVATSAGVKADTKTIAAGKNTQTDLKLTDAEQVNKFDETFIEELKTELAAYRKTLKSIYDASKSKTSKETLSKTYDYVGVLIGDTTQEKSGTDESTPATN